MLTLVPFILLRLEQVAHGYKSRWFVLDNGTLSCKLIFPNLLDFEGDEAHSLLPRRVADFRNSEEENKACRGSVHLKFAQVKATSSTGFDISSSGSDSRFPRYSLKASHPQEAANWSQVSSCPPSSSPFF